jgi:hypothetical protein
LRRVILRFARAAAVNLMALAIFSDDRLAWKLLVLRVISRVVTIVLKASFFVFSGMLRRLVNV